MKKISLRKISLGQEAMVPLIVASSLFMEQLDGSIIATSLPVIAKALGTSPLHLNLAITTYLFSVAIFIPLSSWMADRFGARNVFRGAILVFTLSSALCGFSDTIWELVIARFLQGMGGSMMLPIGRLLIMRSVQRHQVVDALSWVAIPAMIGPILGPPLGGLIVTHVSWRWIFLINVPIGLFGIWVASRYIPFLEPASAGARLAALNPQKERLDHKGFAILAVTLGCLVFAFETIGKDIFPREVIGGLLVFGLFGLAFYARHAKRKQNPVVDLSLLKLQSFRASTIGGGLFRTGVSALPFLLPMMLQVGFGLSPLRSGFTTFASAIGACSIKAFAAPLLRRYGFRKTMILATFFSGMIVAGCGFFSPSTPTLLISAILLCGGWAWSLQFTALHAIAFAELDDARMSQGTTLFSMIQQFSRSMGVAVSSLLLSLTLLFAGRDSLQASDFMVTFFGIAAVSLSSLPFFFALPPTLGDNLTRRDAAKISAESTAELTEDA